VKHVVEGNRRRTIPLDEATLRCLTRRRADQAAERLAAGPAWEGGNLIVTTRQGGIVLPRSYDRALERIVKHAELPRLTSHGLRHTATTHLVSTAADVGELRAIADILGHSPEMLLNTYSPCAAEKPERRRGTSRPANDLSVRSVRDSKHQ